jgi:hypothetical protein
MHLSSIATSAALRPNIFIKSFFTGTINNKEHAGNTCVLQTVTRASYSEPWSINVFSKETLATLSMDVHGVGCCTQ